jgi:hypothetical protein
MRRAQCAGMVGLRAISLVTVMPGLQGRGVYMPRLKVIEGRGRKRVLVYGMRLFEVDAVDKVNRAEIVTSDGRSTRVTMHVIEGTIAQIKKQLAASIDAFFELHDEVR